MSAPPADLATRAGFEIELIAPRGASRRTVADALAAAADGTVAASFFFATEPSLVPGRPVFHHLSPAFDVVDGAGAPLCRVVDDVTIVDDLDRTAAAPAGWYRILSDDARFLRLVSTTCDAGVPIGEVLAPLARLFAVAVVEREGIAVVDDPSGATVAMAAPLVGERERPCEIVTPPWADRHGERLAQLLAAARHAGCTVPVEAAVHVHLDAAPLRDARVLRDLVRLVAPRSALLRAVLATNPRCRRLGPLPAKLVELVERPRFVRLGWDDARAQLREVGLVKYADVNVANVVDPPPGKDTIEWRILPGSIDAAEILAGAALCEAIVRTAVAGGVPRRSGTVAPTAAEAKALFELVGLDRGSSEHLLARQAAPSA